MAISKIEDTRVRKLNDLPPREKGEYVLYWMQQSERAEHNPALEHAARRANQHGKPLLVGFGLMGGYLVHAGLIKDPIVATSVIQEISGRPLGPEGRRLIPSAS